jgi:TetR/AcrR family transcriptional regulator, repressor for neighboring sulfatase
MELFSIMSIVAARPRRRRRTAEESREEALAAAQQLLLDGGPEAVTLQAVASMLGMTHANLIHRFGSAAGLQAALMARMVNALSETIRKAAFDWRAGGGTPTDLVEPVFQAFSKGGGGRLAARIALSARPEHLKPISEALSELTHDLEAPDLDAAAVRQIIAESTLLTVYMAFGDALIGGPLRQMLGLGEGDPQRLTAELMSYLAEARMAAGHPD